VTTGRSPALGDDTRLARGSAAPWGPGAATDLLSHDSPLRSSRRSARLTKCTLRCSRTQTTRQRLLHTFDHWRSCKSALFRCTYRRVGRRLITDHGRRFKSDLRIPHRATGRAFGHLKSRRLFGLLGGAERRTAIVVLPPRSTVRAELQRSSQIGRSRLSLISAT
jgi:hypothetical protein